MTPAEQQAVDQITSLPGTGRLTRADVSDIVAGASAPNAPVILSILVADYRASGTLPIKEWWQEALAIVVAAGEELVPLVGPLEKLIEALLILVADVSRFQGPRYPFAALASAGVRGVYIEATRGNDGPNPYFQAQVDAALAAGLAVGAYHFCYPLPDEPGHVNRDPLGQASLFWQTAQYLYGRDDATTMQPMADCEWPEQPAFAEWGVTPSSMAEWIVSFCANVAAIFLRGCGVYADPSWWGALPADEVRGLRDLPLWLAEYPVAGPLSAPPPNTVPAGLAPWSYATLWQFTDAFTLPGCSPCDGSAFFGGETEWAAFLEG